MFSLKALLAALVLAIGVPIALSQTNPVRLATTARIDLTSPNVNLTNGQVLSGTGQLKRADWLGSTAQSRSYTVDFTINHLDWNEVGLRFVPTANGTVECNLMGPWAATANGRVYKQEVLWDAVEVTGAELKNGSFENTNEGWRSGAVIDRAPANLPAVHGQHYGRAWHDQPLRTTLEVTAGTPVVLRAQARAVLPPNHPEMRRIADTNSPAHVAARRFLRGANFGNFLEVPPSQTWVVPHTITDLKRMRAEGFDHVRIPVGWHHFTGREPEYRLSDRIFEKVDVLVTNALSLGLNVILNIHHFDQFTSDPASHRNRFIAIWRQLAQRYRFQPNGLAFELLNEPRDKATTQIMNPIHSATISEIRKVSPGRTIFVGPGKWNAIDELPLLILPNDDSNIVVTVHNYEPFYFTHQGANWTKGVTDTKGIVFPGPPAAKIDPAPAASTNATVVNWIKDYNNLPAGQNPSSRRAFSGTLKFAKQWSDYYGRPIHVGEFGCVTDADAGSRARYYSEFRKACEELGLGWAVWDWKAGFKYWDDKTQQPMAGMREALFGQ